MDRRKRDACKGNKAVERINEMARAIDRAMMMAGVPPSDKEMFLKWTISQMWESFKQERMNRRLTIENEIRNLGLRFPNGTVEKEYSVSFSLPIEKISNVELIGASELGLSFVKGENGLYSLSGTPKTTGDYVLTLRYDTIEGEDRSELKIPVAFNPNPRSLWHNIPTDKNIKYYKPDCDTDYIKVVAGADGIAKKDIVAASQRGRSHAREGKPRDDHFKIQHCKDSDWYVIAVADGAGSAKYSRKGSEVACETVVEHCIRLLADNEAFESAVRAYGEDLSNVENRSAVTRFVYDIVFKGAVKAHEAVNKLASHDENDKVKDYNTTLMFAISKKYDFGWFIASFWVGDGAMCLFDEKNGTAKLLGVPDEGEFSGQTRFLNMPGIFREPDAVAKRLRMAIVPDFTALFLMTDGVSDPMFETDRSLNDYARWQKFWNRIRKGFPEDGISGVDLTDDNDAAKNQLLGWLDFWSSGNHDDRTIAILY